MTKSTLPEGYRYQKAHTTKWAVFYGLNELVGWVRKVKLTGDFYYRLVEPNWSGPFSAKDEAAKSLIERWTL